MEKAYNQNSWDEFVLGLKKSHSEDNRSTDCPIFVVQEKKTAWHIEESEADFTSWVSSDGDMYKYSQDLYDAQEAAVKHEINGVAIDQHDELFSDLEAKDQEDVIESWSIKLNYGFRRESGRYYWDDVNYHLTLEAAERFTVQQAHNHGELRVYVKSLYHCHEFKKLLKAIINGELVLKAE